MTKVPNTAELDCRLPVSQFFSSSTLGTETDLRSPIFLGSAPMHVSTETFHIGFLIANSLAAAGLISAALAMGIGIYHRRDPHYRWLAIMLCGLFISAGVGRAFRAFSVGGYGLLIIDSIAGVFAIALGIAIWSVIKGWLSLPPYEQVEAMNEKLKEANDKLNRQQRLFEAFMENSPALAFMEDENGRLVYVNKAFENQVQLKREQLIGKPTALWVAPESVAVIKQQHREAIESDQAISNVVFSQHQTGTKAEPWLAVRFGLPSNSEGAVVGAFAVSLSSEYERRELNSIISSIVESSHDAIISKDLNGVITSWNNGAEELYGYTAAEIVGKNLSILVPPDYVNELTECLDKSRRGIRIDNFETVRITKEGKLKDVSESVSPIRDAKGAIIGAAVTTRDVAVVKRQREQIEELNVQLKNRIYELAESNAALQTARDQALEASNLKSAFCTNISHEIRTPLSGIIGLNELLLQSGKLEGDELMMASMIQQSAESLLTVVNDILDLSKIEAGRITLLYAPFNPGLLLQDCTRLMAPAAHQKSLEYELTIDQAIPDMVYGDVSRLRQVLLNIIGNAIKFTEEGSVIVSAHAISVSEDSAELEFRVKDSGIGIAPEDQKFLFMPFAQIDNSNTRKFGGTGLGLSLSKRFVEMMGGKMFVSSSTGKGSTFSFRLTLDRKKLHDAEELDLSRIMKPAVEPAPCWLARGRKVLVVEDNAVLQALAMRQLSYLGIEAKAVVLGRDAVNLALSDQFDLILMDINLPDISGLEATAAIRSLEDSANRAPIPIIAMTAGAMQGDRERALTSGMNDYLAKPVAIENLKSTVELWLSRSQVRPHAGRRGLENERGAA